MGKFSIDWPVQIKIIRPQKLMNRICCSFEWIQPVIILRSNLLKFVAISFAFASFSPKFDEFHKFDLESKYVKAVFFDCKFAFSRFAFSFSLIRKSDTKRFTADNTRIPFETANTIKHSNWRMHQNFVIMRIKVFHQTYFDADLWSKKHLFAWPFTSSNILLGLQTFQ